MKPSELTPLTALVRIIGSKSGLVSKAQHAESLGVGEGGRVRLRP
jgi:hypothetical protein